MINLESVTRKDSSHALKRVWVAYILLGVLAAPLFVISTLAIISLLDPDIGAERATALSGIARSAAFVFAGLIAFVGVVVAHQRLKESLYLNDINHKKEQAHLEERRAEALLDRVRAALDAVRKDEPEQIIWSIVELRELASRSPEIAESIFLGVSAIVDDLNEEELSSIDKFRTEACRDAIFRLSIRYKWRLQDKSKAKELPPQSRKHLDETLSIASSLRIFGGRPNARLALGQDGGRIVQQFDYASCDLDVIHCSHSSLTIMDSFLNDADIRFDGTMDNLSFTGCNMEGAKVSARLVRDKNDRHLGKHISLINTNLSHATFYVHSSSIGGIDLSIGGSTVLGTLFSPEIGYRLIIELLQEENDLDDFYYCFIMSTGHEGLLVKLLSDEFEFNDGVAIATGFRVYQGSNAIRRATEQLSESYGETRVPGDAFLLVARCPTVGINV